MITAFELIPILEMACEDTKLFPVGFDQHERRAILTFEDAQDGTGKGNPVASLE